jgi:hypothetical protein
MICTYCGLETGSPMAHETQEACIEALRSRVSELRSVLHHTRQPGDPGVFSEAVVPENAAVAGVKRGDGTE